MTTSCVGVYNLVKFEISKYYLYIKYENLVNIFKLGKQIYRLISIIRIKKIA